MITIDHYEVHILDIILATTPYLYVLVNQDTNLQLNRDTNDSNNCLEN